MLQEGDRSSGITPEEIATIEERYFPNDSPHGLFRQHTWVLLLLVYNYEGLCFMTKQILFGQVQLCWKHQYGMLKRMP